MNKLCLKHFALILHIFYNVMIIARYTSKFAKSGHRHPPKQGIPIQTYNEVEQRWGHLIFKCLSVKRTQNRPRLVLVRLQDATSKQISVICKVRNSLPLCITISAYIVFMYEHIYVESEYLDI